MRKSAVLFGRGVLRHFWFWVPGVFLGLLELVQRETGQPIDVPTQLFWLVFGLGLFFAAFLAFHDLRKAADPDASLAVRRGIGDEIGAIINEGESMVHAGLPNDELSRRAADWWNSAGIFIEAVLGPAERQIISEPQSAPFFSDLITAHCNLLRGTLQRLPSTDLRVDREGLHRAIILRKGAVES